MNVINSMTQITAKRQPYADKNSGSSNKAAPHLRLTADEIKARKDFMRCDQYLADLLASMKAIGWKFLVTDIPEFCEKIGLSIRTFQRARQMLIESGRLMEQRINRDSIEFFLLGDYDRTIAQNDRTIAQNDRTIAQNDTPIVITPLKPTPQARYENSSDLLSDHYSDPFSLLEEQREALRKNETEEPESSIIPIRTESSPVSKMARDDNFSAAPRNSSIKEFPIGPWGQDLFSIHPGFMAMMIAKWRKGNSAKSQAFGSMVDEEVRGCIQKYWRRDWGTLLIDWNEYEASTRRAIQTVHDRMEQGIEITAQEQKILTDRVMGPHQPMQTQLSPSTNYFIAPKPVEQTEEEKQRMKAAIEAARKSLHIDPIPERQVKKSLTTAQIHEILKTRGAAA